MALCTSRARTDALSVAAPLRSAFGELFRVARQPLLACAHASAAFWLYPVLLAACKTLASMRTARFLLLSPGRQLVA